MGINFHSTTEVGVSEEREPLKDEETEVEMHYRSSTAPIDPMSPQRPETLVEDEDEDEVEAHHRRGH